jgi:hypothetical protein
MAPRPFVARLGIPPVRVNTAASIAVAALLVATVSCNERTVTSTDPAAVAPSPTPAPTPVPIPAPVPSPNPAPPPLPLTLVSVTLDRASLFAGETTAATVQLSRPAPTSGVVVTLTSSDPAALVSPQSVTVAQDKDRATFSVSTSQTLSEDRRVPITASMTDSSTSATVQVWTKPRAQTFFTFISEPGEFIGAGSFVRVTSPETRFVVTGNTTRVTVFMVTPSWYARFEAPLGSQLSTRRYDNIVWVADETHAGMEISGQGRGCMVVGSWFDVRDFSVASNGDVSRLNATFEQRCFNNAATLRGEIRFVR